MTKVKVLPNVFDVGSKDIAQVVEWEIDRIKGKFIDVKFIPFGDKVRVMILYSYTPDYHSKFGGY